MEYKHVPVMPTEVLQALQPQDGGRYADGTIGGAGHAAMILEASETGSWLGGSDRDGAAVEAASFRLAPYSGRLNCGEAHLFRWQIGLSRGVWTGCCWIWV